MTDPAFLLVAWDRVRGNRGARTAGVDGHTAMSIALGTGVEEFLDALRGSLKQRGFRPLPVRERMIPKANGKLRRLGIATITDRVVQASLNWCWSRFSRRISTHARMGFARIAGHMTRWPRCATTRPTLMSGSSRATSSLFRRNFASGPHGSGAETCRGQTCLGLGEGVPEVSIRKSRGGHAGARRDRFSAVTP